MCAISSRKSEQASFPLACLESSPQAEGMKVSRQEAGERGSQALKGQRKTRGDSHRPKGS